MGRRMILEIGCGEQKVIDGSIGVDIRRTEVVDIIADARKLPFKDSCFDHIYTSHLIEHFSHREVKEVLYEWVRVLKPGGELELRCPDLQARALIFSLRPSWENVKNIYGEQDYSGNYHKCGFSYRMLKELLETVGIKRVRRILRRGGYMGIPFLPDCLHVKGVKDSQYGGNDNGSLKIRHTEMERALYKVGENERGHRQQNPRIACVIVTYNNARNIGKLLEALFNQSNPITEIILVDNASSDGTAQMVKQMFPQVTLFVNSSNTGVGGGYAQGMKYAYKKGYNWIWLLDGDSLPQVSALEQLMTALVNLMPVHPKIGILASSPTNPSTGQIYGGFIRRGLFHKIPKEITHFRKPVPVDTVISSGCLVSDKVVGAVGLPRPDFFMDFVDAEYNLRVLRKGYEIISVPTSVIYHQVGEPRIIRSRIIRFAIRILLRKGSLSSSHPAWRKYYAFRNELYTFWHEFRSYRAVFRLMLATVATILGIMLFNDKEKSQRVKYIFRGLVDGFKGKMGKIVTPAGEDSNNTGNMRRSKAI